MRAPVVRPASSLFARYAAISLVPVLILGVVLSSAVRTEARHRGLAEGKAEAALVAHTAIEPALAGHLLSSGLNADEQANLHNVVDPAIRDGRILKLRLRDLSGRVVFGALGAPDDEAIGAAHGEEVGRLTHLNTDTGDDGPTGTSVVEVYRPIVNGQNGTRIGVLEIYLPYTPIAADINAGVHRLYVDLAIGLLLLYLVLIGVATSTTRRLRRHAEENEFLARYDPVTGLPNRAQFLARATEALNDANQRVTIAVVDLDRFKEVNDTLGHANGDALLTEVGRRLSVALREDEFVARIGGDEFGLVLPGAGTANTAANRLHRLRLAVTEEMQIGEIPVAIEASFGFAIAPIDGTDVGDLLQRADVAMYDAKRSQDGVAHYDSSRDEYDATKLALVAELRRAIDRDELLLRYQPKVRVDTGTPYAVEALVRWQHPTHGLLAPDRFLPIAEQTGLIESLTRWVLTTALRQLHEWSDTAADLAISVNVSARDITRVTFADTVLDALYECNVEPSRLILEVTETALLSDPNGAARVLRRLAAAGVRVGIDDFGRGQTSLGYLGTLPVHQLKIDKSFVTDMLRNEMHEAIVRAVVELGHNLGFEVVAEGVETSGVLECLRSMSCDVAQGFLFARPLEAGALLEWLDARTPVPAPRTAYPANGPLAPTGRPQ